jgi:hypothetical protein
MTTKSDKGRHKERTNTRNQALENCRNADGAEGADLLLLALIKKKTDCENVWIPDRDPG